MYGIIHLKLNPKYVVKGTIIILNPLQQSFKIVVLFCCEYGMCLGEYLIPWVYTSCWKEFLKGFLAHPLFILK